MATGTVKWFNATKGFGFIAPESGGKDVFVHISAVERSGLTGLADNQKVTYDLEAGRDGRESAVNGHRSIIGEMSRAKSPEGRSPLKSAPPSIRAGGPIGFDLRYNSRSGAKRFFCRAALIKPHRSALSAMQQGRSPVLPPKPLCFGKNPPLFSNGKQPISSAPNIPQFNRRPIIVGGTNLWRRAWQ
jgi:CspA family cold shock protein